MHTNQLHAFLKIHSSKRTYVEITFLWRKGNEGKLEMKMQKYINAEQYLGIVWVSITIVMSHYTCIYFYGQKFKIVLQGCSFFRI